MKCKLSGVLASWTFASLFLGPTSALAQPPSLGTAQSYAVLAGSAVTNTGPTVVTGDLGLSPGSAVTGFPPGIVIGGTIHAADAAALQAQSDLTNAYVDLAGRSCTSNLSSQDLGGLTLTPGVYCFSTSAQLTGTLTLDAQGNAGAVFIFQIGSTLTTASAASVLLINSAQACNVFWQVGSSATLGTGSSLSGSILALTSITLTTGASISGRALARNGATTLDSSQVTVAVCAGATATPTATPTGPSPPTSTGTPTSPATLTPSPTLTGAVASPTQTSIPGLPTLTATAVPTSTGLATPTCPILCIRQNACFRWELISASSDSGLVTFTWRLTNFCRGRLASAEFLITHGGPVVVSPEPGQVYVSPRGDSYTVQINKGSVPGVIFNAPRAGTIHNGESDLFVFTTTESGIDSGTFFWNSARTTDGERGLVDIQVGSCPAGCDPDPVRDASARRRPGPGGEWDILVRWSVHPWSSLRLFDLYRVRSSPAALQQVNTAPMRPDAAGLVSVDDLVAPDMVDRYRIQPLDAQGNAVGPAVTVQVEAPPSLVSLGAWPLLLILLALGSGIVLRGRRRALAS